MRGCGRGRRKPFQAAFGQGCHEWQREGARWRNRQSQCTLLARDTRQAVRISFADGRFPGSRVDALSSLPRANPSGVSGALSAYSCGDSCGIGQGPHRIPSKDQDLPIRPTIAVILTGTDPSPLHCGRRTVCCAFTARPPRLSMRATKRLRGVAILVCSARCRFR